MFSQNLLDKVDELRESLNQSFVVIENALDTDIANELRNSLLQSDKWSTTDIVINEFNYKRKEIRLEEHEAPDIIKQLYSYLLSAEIKTWASEVSNKKVDNFIGAATIFGQHDHISEHNDYFTFDEPGKPRQSRTLTFNYYLSKNWDPANGGGFVWKDPRVVLNNTFNTLVLFKPGPLTHHWVEPVTVDTDEKRLSITGWYTSYINKDKFKLSL